MNITYRNNYHFKLYEHLLKIYTTRITHICMFDIFLLIKSFKF